MVWRKLGRRVSSLLNFENDYVKLVEKTGQNIVLPLYHAVSDKPPIHLKHLYPVKSLNEFKKDIKFFKNNFDPISLADLHSLLINKTIPRNDKYFHISFDDGLSEVYTQIAPILVQEKIPASIFINTDFVNNKALFFRYKASILYDSIEDKSLLNLRYRDTVQLDRLAKSSNISFREYLSKYNPYLTWRQLEELNKSGFTIGAHSSDHPHYSDIPLDLQLQKTRDSLEIVQERFHQCIRSFAFPFTDDGVSTSFFKGIEPDLDISFGCAGIKIDSMPMHFQRIPMEKSNSSAEEIIKKEYAYFQLRKLFDRNVIRRS